jgi:prophage antirepressor-like protein
MSEIFSTLDEHYIKFEDKKITVIIDNDNNTWFNANETAKALGYAYPKLSININVDKTDKIKLEDINIDIKIDKHPHSIYLSESGLYSLMLTSKLKKAKKFKLWITEEVLPSIRKYGFYKMKTKYEKDYQEILQEIDKLQKDNKHMKNDMKKEKFPEGGLIYVIDYTDETKDAYRIGSTDDMNKNFNNLAIKEYDILKNNKYYKHFWLLDAGHNVMEHPIYRKQIIDYISNLC